MRRSTNSDQTVYDVGSGFYAFLAAATIYDYCFTLDVREFSVQGAEAYKAWLSKVDHHQDTAKQDVRTLAKLSFPVFFPGTIWPLESECLGNERGIGYVRGPELSVRRFKAGYEAYIDAQSLKDKPDEAWTIKKRALFEALFGIILHHVILDLTAAIFANPLITQQDRLAPPYRLYDVALGPAGFVGVCLVKLATASFIVSGMQYMEHIVRLIEIALAPAWKMPIVLARYDPACTDVPHISTSLQEFWNKRWQQRHRRLFLVAGYRPAKRFANALGLPRRFAHAAGTLGAFLVSGIAHELCLETLLPHFSVWNARMGIEEQTIRTPDRGFGAREFAMTRFFLVQGIAIIAEKAWQDVFEPAVALYVCRRTKQQSTRLVSGKFRSLLGWTWCMTWMMYTAYDFCDLWLQHGFATVPAYGRQRPLTAPILNAVLSKLFTQ